MDNDSTIVRVWGKADEYELEFTRSGNGKWTAVVPKDMEDGQYAALVYAIDNSGRIVVWTGILYMSAGTCCLKLKPENYTIELLPERVQLSLKAGCRCG